MVFYRFFYSIKTMSHDKMQEYVNVDYAREFSLVGFGGKKGEGKMIAEARLVVGEEEHVGEVAFLIDETYQGAGVGSYLMDLLIVEGRNRGLHALCAQVLSDNQPMIKVFEKTGLPVESRLESGVYQISIDIKK